MTIIEHYPATEQLLIQYRGDTIVFTLKLDKSVPGSAWLRTNIGHAQEHRQEIIDHVEKKKPLLSLDWHDIPMQADANKTTYTIEMPLAEVGRFQGKAFFLPEGTNDPVWPEGNNVIIKVEPAATVCGNSIYTAFVRQFGPNMSQKTARPQRQKIIEELDDDGYTVIPKSGTFRNLISQLDHIINTMGFGIIQLLPIHPVPTTYARMGRFGSPFASIDFFDVDPALAEFDRKTTPLDQFAELVDGIHARNAFIYLDLPINHTGWASHLQMHHPEWFARNHDSSFTSPGAWGVIWEDLSELDYDHFELWQYMADVFLFWCRRGVNGFRCDAGYMVPLPVWEYISAKVRQEFPDTIFLLEGLGGKTSTTKALLDRANLNWAYSEIFQIDDRSQMESYLPHCQHICNNQGTLIHFAETHDNNRLAAKSTNHARLRTTLAALLSEAGAFGITNGVEWFATTKVDVHRAEPLNWGATTNQISEIAQINKLLNNHNAFMRGVTQRLIQTDAGNSIALLRSPKDSDPILILANLDDQHETSVSWKSSDFDSNNEPLYDLLTNEEYSVKTDGSTSSKNLSPAQVLCLSRSSEISSKKQTTNEYKATVLSLYRQLTGNNNLQTTDVTTLVRELKSDPESFCTKISKAPLAQSITTWQWPQDLQRDVMLPFNHTLLIKSPQPFHAELKNNEISLAVENSLINDSGEFFAFLTPPSCNSIRTLNINITAFQESKHQVANIIQLPSGAASQVAQTLDRETIRNSKHYALLTNNRGAISQVQLEWSKIESQYDCLLGANLNDQVPVDRHIAFTRCRAWLVHRDYSQAITTDCIQNVTINPGNSITWTFDVPIGMGKSVTLKATLQLIKDENRIELHFEPTDTTSTPHDLTSPITLLLRPDIEDRNFHETTKAHAGPEHNWPKAVKPHDNGFSFSPSGVRTLDISIPGSTFIHEAEWAYGIPHPFEAQRGLSNSGDLFSPGYFKADLTISKTTTLTATLCSGTRSQEPEARSQKSVSSIQNPEPSTQPPAPSPLHTSPFSLANVMKQSMKAFIVKRDETRTVIAGYPWFLDWGRDTLICLRGIISAGMHDEAKDILIQFAGFEKQGTLPNMIRGNDDSNRDTSDAPLWFFTACADLIQAEKSNTNKTTESFLDLDCKGRTIRQILTSIANHYINGTPNGIIMDPETALIFSPSHYTWMDTNHPAGTPREGYPIEIQALWFAALKLMVSIDDNPRWQELAIQVQESVIELYTLPDRNYLSDCLHAQAGTPAKQATADNALRPNQLFAITLGLITDNTKAQGILSATEKLLIPGAIRTIADQQVSPPLPVYRDGQLLNNPDNPYWGSYAGDEDTRRKPAYHNGTAWTWPFPSYSEALYASGGEPLRQTALSLLSSSTTLANNGCIGHIPEILDANVPHHQRGCGAQAWGETELYRVLALLNG